ncbi:MAG: hypothetical protein HFI90_00445 [Clostridia bacterium]|nr:hypothetical protein [Clostridia bacterium]
MDFFNENLVQRKKTGKDVAIIVGIILLGIVLTCALLLFLLGMPIVGQFFLLLIAGVWFLAYRLISGRKVEFEYIVTNSDMDVDKIVAKRKRTRILSLNAKEIEIMAPVNDPDFQREQQNVNIVERMDISSGNPEARRYFAVFMREGKRTMIIFEPTRKMLAIFKRYRPQDVHLAPEDVAEL